jgi:NAD(P)H-dependent FMN reductase
MKLFAFAGSLRKGSLNHQLIRLAAAAAREQGAEVDLARLADFDIPLYSGDIEEQGIPSGVQALGERMAAADAYLIAAPEYNYSIAGPLKNALDWISRLRPVPIADKIAMTLSASPSPVGGERGLLALRTPLMAMGCLICPRGFVLPLAGEKFDPEGNFVDEKWDERLQQALINFLAGAEALCDR